MPYTHEIEAALAEILHRDGLMSLAERVSLEMPLPALVANSLSNGYSTLRQNVAHPMRPNLPLP